MDPPPVNVNVPRMLLIPRARGRDSWKISPVAEKSVNSRDPRIIHGSTAAAAASEGGGGRVTRKLIN